MQGVGVAPRRDAQVVDALDVERVVLVERHVREDVLVDRRRRVGAVDRPPEVTRHVGAGHESVRAEVENAGRAGRGSAHHHACTRRSVDVRLELVTVRHVEEPHRHGHRDGRDRRRRVRPDLELRLLETREVREAVERNRDVLRARSAVVARSGTQSSLRRVRREPRDVHRTRRGFPGRDLVEHLRVLVDHPEITLAVSLHSGATMVVECAIRDVEASNHGVIVLGIEHCDGEIDRIADLHKKVSRGGVIGQARDSKANGSRVEDRTRGIEVIDHSVFPGAGVVRVGREVIRQSTLALDRREGRTNGIARRNHRGRVNLVDAMVGSDAGFYVPNHAGIRIERAVRREVSR